MPRGERELPRAPRARRLVRVARRVPPRPLLVERPSLPALLHCVRELVRDPHDARLRRERVRPLLPDESLVVLALVYWALVELSNYLGRLAERRLSKLSAA